MCALAYYSHCAVQAVAALENFSNTFSAAEVASITDHFNNSGTALGHSKFIDTKAIYLFVLGRFILGVSQTSQQQPPERFSCHRAIASPTPSKSKYDVL